MVIFLLYLLQVRAVSLASILFFAYPEGRTLALKEQIKFRLDRVPAQTPFGIAAIHSGSQSVPCEGDPLGIPLLHRVTSESIPIHRQIVVSLVFEVSADQQGCGENPITLVLLASSPSAVVTLNVEEWPSQWPTP